jgi:DNA-binding NarL/FixJ family response regulator
MPRRLRIRVLLVDDHSLVRIGLKEQLTGCLDISVVGEASSVVQAVECASRLSPTIVLLDLNLPDGSGAEACRQILADRPGIRVLIMTICDDSVAMQAAMAAGAHGYVLKDVGLDMLLRAVRTVAAGKSFFYPPSIRPARPSSAAADQEDFDGWEKLSPQERRILPLLGEGRTNREIGDALGLSEYTIKNYLSNIFRKLKVTRRTQAVMRYFGSNVANSQRSQPGST